MVENGKETDTCFDVFGKGKKIEILLAENVQKLLDEMIHVATIHSLSLYELPSTCRGDLLDQR